MIHEIWVKDESGVSSKIGISKYSFAKVTINVPEEEMKILFQE
jgi:hypothetical protein